MKSDNPLSSLTADGTNAGGGQAVIRVNRTTSYADRIRAYRIVVDGQEVARLAAGQSIEIPVDRGAHSVVAKVDWCSSPTLKCNVDEGEMIELDCGSNLQGFRILLGFVYILFLRDRYLTLTRR